MFYRDILHPVAFMNVSWTWAHILQTNNPVVPQKMKSLIPEFPRKDLETFF